MAIFNSYVSLPDLDSIDSQNFSILSPWTFQVDRLAQLVLEIDFDTSCVPRGPKRKAGGSRP